VTASAAIPTTTNGLISAAEAGNAADNNVAIDAIAITLRTRLGFDIGKLRTEFLGSHFLTIETVTPSFRNSYGSAGFLARSGTGFSPSGQARRP
jgi:hypothetical protein